MWRWVSVGALALVIASQLASAADRPAPLPDLFMDVFDSIDKVKGRSQPWHGLLRQKLSMAGRDDLIVDLLYAPRWRPKCDPLVRSGRPVDPVAEIVARAKSSGRLVIVNEAHDDAQTRAFIMRLMWPLRDLGFSVYAAETFMRAVGTRSPKWPLIADGFYSYEPTFGELIRLARALDFEFVPYEADEPRKAPENDVAARIAERESTQTKNIMERIITPLPRARVLIHVGHAHLIEKPVKHGLGGENRWMASRLKEASGIDPLTIDQTTFQSPIDRPVVCALASDADKKRALAVDLTIALPKPSIRHGRPDWRRNLGQVEVAVPAGLRPPGLWSIIEARYADEPPEAVPADRILLAPDEGFPLLLRPGRYRVEAWTREHGWTQSVEVVAD